VDFEKDKMPESVTQVYNAEAEKELILKSYRSLLRACKPNMDKGDKKLIRLAFDIALEAHKDMRRKNR